MSQTLLMYYKKQRDYHEEQHLLLAEKVEELEKKLTEKMKEFENAKLHDNAKGRKQVND